MADAAAIAITDGNDEGLLNLLSSRQELGGSVVDGIGPANAAGGAVGIADHRCHGQGAAQAVAGIWCDGGAVGVAPIEVAEHQRSTAGESGGCGILQDQAVDVAVGAIEHWCVIAAGDRDLDHLRCLAALLVVHRDGEAFGDGFTLAEMLNGAIGNGIGPGDFTTAIAGGVVGNRWGQDTEHGASC